jgi:hypothetical protein
MAAEAGDTVQATQAAEHPLLVRLLSFNHMMVLSIVHSFLFTGLMICAFVLAHPQPATFIFGFTHGVLYMIIAALAALAAKLKTIPLTTALVVIILGAFGPYFGSYDFIREYLKRRRGASADEAPAGAG